MAIRSLVFTLSVFITIHSHAQVEDTTYQEIEGVLVTSEKEREVVYEDEKFYIIDFTLSEEKTIILLRSLGRYMLCQLDEQMQLEKDLQFGQNATALYTDCFENIHLITKDSAYLIIEEDSGFSLEEAQPQEEFLEAMGKCVGMSSEKVIFREFTRHYQFQEFYAVDAYDGSRETIYEINDSVRAYSLKDAAQQLYAHIVTDKEKMVSNEMSTEQMDSDEAQRALIRAQREMNAREDRIKFFEMIVAVAKYNPLFVIDDTLHFYNHFEGRLDQLNQSGTKVGSFPLEHHLNPDWQQEIYYDAARDQFYGLFRKEGTYEIRTIFITDNQSAFSTTPLTEHARPKKILIRNGYAYYAFKPNSDAHLNKLYRQKL